MSNQSPAKTILMLMQTLTRQLRKQADDAAHQLHELTMLQLQALFYINEQGKASMTELARELSMGGPSATSLVDRLVDAGWLARNDDPEDRRVTVLTLTEKAGQELSKHLARKIERVQSLVQTLTKEEQDRFIRLLEKIVTLSPEEGQHDTN